MSPDDARLQSSATEPVEFLVRRLANIREETGQVPASMVQFVADSAGVDARTVYRWIARGTRQRKVREATRLTPHVRTLYFELNGSIARIVRHCQAEGIACPPRETLRRLVNHELTAAERAYARQGEHARRANTVYLQRASTYRNAIWEADHKQLGVLVKPPHSRAKPVDPWLTTFMDSEHRVIAGVAISLQPTAGDVLAAFRSAVLRDPSAPNALWGVPDEVHWDNGLEFLSSAVTEVAQTLGVLPRALRSYSPHLKGRIERWHRTLDEEFLATLPFWQAGPRGASGQLYGSEHAQLSYELFCAKLLAWIDHYNFERPHSALGGLTPAASWHTDETAVREVDAEDLRWMSLPSRRCRVGQSGIHHRGHKYVDADGRLIALRGETVEIRYMPHDERSIDVYRHGAFICTATVSNQLDADAQKRFLAERQRQLRQASRERQRASRRARVRIASITRIDDTPEQVTVFDHDQAHAEGFGHRDEAPITSTGTPAGLNQPWTPPVRRGTATREPVS